MKIKGKTVTFDNGMSFGIGDSYQETIKKLDGTELHSKEDVYAFFLNKDILNLGYSNCTSLLFYEEKKDGLTEIEIEFFSDKYRLSEEYEKSVEEMLCRVAELKTYLLEQFPNGKILGSGDKGITMIVDDIMVNVTAGREFESLKMHFWQKDYLKFEK